jgi:Family of unknown function (DUF6504)
MARSYDDLVHVRTPLREDEQVQEATAPQAFVWRGRLYVVRDVLAHWYERRAWWTEGLARAVHGQPEVAADPVSEPSPGIDREVWRVEASAGRHAGTGVYDLCPGPEGSQTWRLLRVTD